MSILTDNEKQVLKSMSQYWNEVNRREDKTPLFAELQEINRVLGTKILFIISHYIELIEEIKK